MIAHQDSLRAFIFSLMPGSPDIDDVLQNTNAVLWKKKERFKVGTNFQAWAFKIARYQTRHQMDRYKRDGRLVFSDKIFDMIADTAPKDRSQDRIQVALDGCLEKLSDSQRELINGRYTPGRSLEQLAASGGKTAGSLRIALHRIREMLKSCVENTLAGESA